MMAYLELPQYKEYMEMEEKWFDLGKIFGKEKKEDKPRVPERTEPKQEKKVWEKIKDIFKKKGKK